MLGTYPDLGCRTFDIKHLGHTQCTRCEKFCDQVKKIWGAFSEKENQLRFPKALYCCEKDRCVSLQVDDRFECIQGD